MTVESFPRSIRLRSDCVHEEIVIKGLRLKAAVESDSECVFFLHFLPPLWQSLF